MTRFFIHVQLSPIIQLRRDTDTFGEAEIAYSVPLDVEVSESAFVKDIIRAVFQTYLPKLAADPVAISYADLYRSQKDCENGKGLSPAATISEAGIVGQRILFLSYAPIEQPESTWPLSSPVSNVYQKLTLLQTKFGPNA